MTMLNWATAKKRSRMARQRHGRPMTLGEVPAGMSGYRGVHRGKRGKFRAVIEVDGVRRHLGYFADPVIAAHTYDAVARDVWGPSAITNFGGQP